jgi:hypothetical protein
VDVVESLADRPDKRRGVGAEDVPVEVLGDEAHFDRAAYLRGGDDLVEPRDQLAGLGRPEVQQGGAQLGGGVACDLAHGVGAELGAVAVARQVLERLQRGVVQRRADLSAQLGHAGAALGGAQLADQLAQLGGRVAGGGDQHGGLGRLGGRHVVERAQGRHPQVTAKTLAFVLTRVGETASARP